MSNNKITGWELTHKPSGYGHQSIIKKDGEAVADVRDWPGAAGHGRFIVKACNMHDEFRYMLGRVVDYVQEVYHNDYYEEDDCHCNDHFLIKEIEELLAKAKEA